MANAGMRNSAGEVISVIAGSLILAGIMFTVCGQKCFKELVSLSVFSSINCVAMLVIASIVLVYIYKSLTENCWAFYRFCKGGRYASR